MLVGVDGTGPSDDRKYWDENHSSFISRLVRQAGGLANHAYYMRGPTNLGLECAKQADRVATIIAARKIGVHGERVFLAGHSRGGAIVIVAARHLHARGIPVDAMFLFDAVDRSVVISGTNVFTPNVRAVYHALRDKGVKSRAWFGNCGLVGAFPGQLEMKRFFTTHAGVGGTPWTGDKPSTTDELHDKCNSRLVEQWMWLRLLKHGVVKSQ